MDSDDKAQWMVILDSASTQHPDEVNEEWQWLLDGLGLSEEYFPAVLEAIHQGRWRTARNPRTYVKTVAKRIAFKADRPSKESAAITLVKSPSGDRAFSMENELEFLAHQSSSHAAFKSADGVWRSGGGWDEHYDHEEEDEPYQEYLSSLATSEVRTPVEMNEETKAIFGAMGIGPEEIPLVLISGPRLDWDRWAADAGFDQWDCEVLRCRLCRISRDQALSEQPDETSRKALQAAWRKFDRTGFARLRETAKQIGAKMSRNR
jgi:hypothetical protein